MFRRLLFCSFLLLLSFSASTQCWNLVWEDDFSGNSLDLTKWSYQIGGEGWGNNELQYYTAGDNITVSNGILKISAQEDIANDYPDNDYTSSRIRSRFQGDWRYGKMEARLRMPQGQGLWPAFWMMPSYSVYGGWPSSGEIDIMEYLGHNTNTTYGTCHYGNSPSDKGSSGASTSLSSGTFSADFHLFAIEWEEDEIRWYLDGTQFHSINSSHPDFSTYHWPFDQEFHFILNLAVGGNWPGSPDEFTVFPADFEIDWVRAYQKLTDLTIAGDVLVEPGASSSYTVTETDGASYFWTAPSGASIIAGQGTANITINWGSSTGGELMVDITNNCGSVSLNKTVEVSPNLWANYGFEEGTSFWNTNTHNGTSADFVVSTTNPQEGSQSLCVTTNAIGSNVWDIQLSRPSVELESAENYTLSFWAKSDQAGQDVNIAFIDANTFDYYAGTSFTLSDQWAFYGFDFEAPASATSLCNFDLGDELGTFCFDNFAFTRTALLSAIADENLELYLVNKKDVAIRWNANNHQDIRQFLVQRLFDYTNWQTIGTVDMQPGTTNYQVIDTKADEGENYYRIASKNKEGTIFYSTARSIIVPDYTLKFYPNPVKDLLYLAETANIEHLKVFNLNGQLVLATDREETGIYDFSTLSSGCYIIEFLYQDDIRRQKIIKN